MFFYKRDNGRSSILYSMLVGSIVGAGLAMLLTPHSGKKMRRRITDMADEAKDYAGRVQKNVSKMYK